MGDDDVDRLIRQTFDDDEEDSAMLAAGDDDDEPLNADVGEKIDVEGPSVQVEKPKSPATTSRMSNFPESDDEPTSGPRCDIEALSRAGTSDDDDEPPSDSHLARMLDQSSMAKSARLLNDLAMSDSGSDSRDDDGENDDDGGGHPHRRDSKRKSAGGDGEDCDFSTL
uniref:Uncharacterized protein n=1 Tax=Romanomermis culicivorax TaxID=13658 RepID=A0A915L6M0_ROMCU